MSKKELKRYKVISQWIEGYITGKQAAELLSLSLRQVYRLKKRVLEEDENGVIHKNRGRKPAHALSEDIRQKILNLRQSETYRHCNDVHFSELLAKQEGIRVSPSTVRRIRCQANIPPKRKRRPAKVHRPRDRKPQTGMLVQIDGSFHRWLEDRAEPMALLAAIDDATGKILAAVFRRQEDTEGYFLLIRQMIEQYGIPMSIYSDRHMIFCSPNEKRSIEQELAGETMPLSQFGRALKDLGITHIKAMTPQAKGRIERLFQTLQDRWIVELRLRGIQTQEKANQVLPELIKEHNEKFAVAPLEPENAFVPLEPGQDPGFDSLFSRSTDRRTRRNHLLPRKNVHPRRPKFQSNHSVQNAGASTKTLDGKLFVWYKGKPYALKEATRNKASTSPEKKKESS
ncbi:ISNCY family transposase [Caldibacillus debilis]|uniref:ISNCY family transposase n=6 Tax=Caldibacillus debilis TaxID=301148 RepID=UPI0023F30636|nr:ISNCY family transposase [Caldibacillus debilis]